MRNPEETAKNLLEEGETLKSYEILQNHRKERLANWEKYGVQSMIKKERKLIAFGEEVLAIMKKLKG